MMNTDCYLHVVKHFELHCGNKVQAPTFQMLLGCVVLQ
jgi:hypothetical protein